MSWELIAYISIFGYVSIGWGLVTWIWLREWKKRELSPSWDSDDFVNFGILMMLWPVLLYFVATGRRK